MLEGGGDDLDGEGGPLVRSPLKMSAAVVLAVFFLLLLLLALPKVVRPATLSSSGSESSSPDDRTSPGLAAAQATHNQSSCT